MENFHENLINAKYHLKIAQRLHENYANFEEKRFLVGIINESAKSVSNIIKCFLIFEKCYGGDSRKNLKIFISKIAPKYFDEITIQNLRKILEIEYSQKISPIEFSKKDKIILLVEGRYRFLRVNRFEEFLKSIEFAINRFSDFSDKYKKVVD
tara:strand:+ start:198 stop:656 length:459 start_codon:yes stop_codon:yes gene_type:complete